MKINNVASAKYLPGHMLLPIQTFSSVPTRAGKNVPAPEPEDNPARIDPVHLQFAILEESLWLKPIGLRVPFRVVHDRPTITAHQRTRQTPTPPEHTYHELTRMVVPAGMK